MKRGRPPLAAQTSTLSPVRCSVALHDRVIQEALRRDVSVAAVVREAIAVYLQTRQESQAVGH